MKGERRRIRAGVRATLALSILGFTASGVVADEARLMLRDPPRAPPRYGITAALARWPSALQLHPRSATSPVSSEFKPVPALTPTTTQGAPQPAALPGETSAPSGAAAARPSSSATEEPIPQPPALSAALVERDLLSRSAQRLLTDANSGAPERRDLALRAVELLWGLPANAGGGGDPLRQTGLERRRFAGAVPVGGRPLGLDLQTVRGRGGQVRRQQWQTGGAAGPALHLSMTEVDRGFGRLDDLTTEERGWAGGMRGMRRMEIGGERLTVAGGKAEVGLLQLSDRRAHARRLALGFTGGPWSLRALSQRADDDFRRLADLTEADRRLFGAERGIARDALDLGYALSGGRKLSATSLSLRAAAGSAERRQFEFQGGPRLQLRLTTGRVDSKFDRIGDLLEPDRAALAPQRGTRWSDLQVNLQPARWLTTESGWCRSASLDTGGQTTRQRSLWTLQLAPRSKLALQRELLETPDGHSGRRQAVTQSLRLEQWLTRSLFFSAFREGQHQGSVDGPTSVARRQVLHLNTAPGSHWQSSADWSNERTIEGKNAQALQWSLALPLRARLALHAKGERRQSGKGPGTHGLVLGLDGKVARAWDLACSLDARHSGPGPGAHDLGLRLSFHGWHDTPSFRETRLVLGVGDTAGLASADPTPKKTSPGAAPGKEIPARQVRSISLETKYRGQPLSLGFHAAVGTIGGLVYRLAAHPFRGLQLEALREIRDLGHTSLIARQRYALCAWIAAHSQLSLCHECQPEQAPGKLLLGHSQTRVEAKTRLAGLETTAALAWDRDQTRRKTAALTSFSLAGSLDARDTLRFSVTGRSGGADPALPLQDLRLALERKADEMLAFAFQAQWRAWQGNRASELAWQLDLTAQF
jgi:hypothetical protein